MRCWTRMVTVASVAVLASATAQAGGVTSIRGKVIFKGDPAKYKRTVIDRSKNPACEKEVEKVETEDVILNEDTNPVTIRNVLVSIQTGLEQHAFPLPPQPAVLMVHGCRYKPHILGLRAGQPLRFYNADELAQISEFLSTTSNKQTIIHPRKDLDEGQETKLVAEPPFPVKSKVYPWMNCYLAVFDHPFFGVTGGTGMYELRGMPPGQYRIDAWHETFGSQSQVVIVTKGETKTVDFTFEPQDR